LAAARRPEEVPLILGRRRVTGYPLGFAAVAVLCMAASSYVIAEVAMDEKSAWTLLLLPAFLFLVLFCGIVGFAGMYFAVAGRRWSKAEKIDRVLGRLNSNI
jgi:hypothetical protein